jgi:N-acetylmuramoyl-L-alanine amidase
MVSDFIQKNVTILRILLIITLLVYYVSSTMQACDVKVLLKENTSLCKLHGKMDGLDYSAQLIFQSMSGRGKVKKVVIDAGHGGHDSGCVGKNSFEKDITLKLAIKVGEMIQKIYPDVTVLQTRTTDVFIPLFRRIQYANEEDADLFISIHCNFISNPKTRGTETFVMGLHRAADNLDVAKRENASILLEKNYEQNYDGFDPNSPEGHIMMSMYQNAYLDKSIEFAADIENQFLDMEVSKSRGVKQAGFAVLRRASMPAVLIEAGFLSNEVEEAFLISESGQETVSNAIFKAFANFYKNNQPYQALVQDEKANNIQTSSSKSNKVDNKPNASVPSDISAPSIASPKNNKVEVVNSLKTTSTLKQDVYKVQVAASKNDLFDMDSAEIRKIGILSIKRQGDMYKYYVGAFSHRADAVIARDKLKKMGYEGAFLVVDVE